MNRRTKVATMETVEAKEVAASQVVAERVVAAGDSEIAKVVSLKTLRKEPSYSTEISRTIG